MGGSVKRFISLACFKSLQPSLHELSNVELVTESQANHGEIPCLWLFVFLRSKTMADKKGSFRTANPGSEVLLTMPASPSLDHY